MFCYNTAALLCHRVIVNKRMYLAPSQRLSRKQIKTILTLCKPLFIVNVRVKALFKVMLEYKNKAPQLEKWAWHMHNEIV